MAGIVGSVHSNTMMVVAARRCCGRNQA